MDKRELYELVFYLLLVIIGLVVLTPFIKVFIFIYNY